MESIKFLLLSILLLKFTMSDSILRTPVKRVDDPAALSAVVEQLATKVNQLDARNTALETEVNTLKARVSNLKCESGTLNFSPHTHDDDPHSTGREHIRYVTFASPFAFPPQVTSGLIHIDADTTDTVRVDVSVDNVAIDGFDMSVTEWLGSVDYGVTVSWMACLV